ncbi:MAG: TIGR04086 family membrane protein [Clostridiaceae bacterium]|nr:TIGR04086 family membrane protein [Clostridiaceae bacterium]
MDTRNFASELLRITVCAAIGLTLTLVAILAATLLIASGKVDEGLRIPAASVAAGLGAVLAGLLAGRRTEKRVALAGIATGGVFLLLLFLLGALFFSNLSLGDGFLPIAVTSVCCTLVGAIATVLQRR